jgi:hypothetical protein
MKYCTRRFSLATVSIAILVFILMWIYLDIAYVAADHISEKERRVYLEEINAEYKSGILSVEDYEGKLEFLEDHDGEKETEEIAALTSSLVGAFISIAVVGAFVFARIRRRNRQEEQVGMPFERLPLQGEVEVDGKPKGIGEIFRDKNRDNLTTALNTLGIRAVMLERGRAEEQIWNKHLGRWGSSLGIVQVAGDQITWVNVVRLARRSQHSPAYYNAVFGIPDSTLPHEHHPIEIKTVRKKSFPVFGKVIDVQWEAKDVLAPLVDVFSKDEDITNFVKDVGDISVHTHPKQFLGWTVEVRTSHRIFLPVVVDQWNVLHKIADYVIASPRN